MKKLASLLLTLFMFGVISGCSLFTKEVDYKKIANDVNQRNMDEVMHAVDGYANIRHTSFTLTSTPQSDSKVLEIKNEWFFEGVYNTNKNNAYGEGGTSKEISVLLKNKNQEQDLKQEDSPDYKIMYTNNQYKVEKTGKVFNLPFLFDKLQGIEKVKPISYSYGLDEPPSVSYKLNEREFQKVLNDDLKIKYDQFKKATILISLKDREKKPYITDIIIGIQWKKKDKNGKMINYFFDDSIFISDNNKNTKKTYFDYKY